MRWSGSLKSARCAEFRDAGLEHHENDRRAQHECRIEAQRQIIGDEAEIRDRPRPGIDRRIRIKEYRQQISGAKAGADCKYRRSGKPVRP
jgi:hypothetical protein